MANESINVDGNFKYLDYGNCDLALKVRLYCKALSLLGISYSISLKSIHCIYTHT
jgi:hypothetical protein